MQYGGSYEARPQHLFPKIYTNLTWGRLFSRLRETAPEPHPTSKHVCWEYASTPGPEFPCRSVSTSSTNSCTIKEEKKEKKKRQFWLCDVSSLGLRDMCGLFLRHLQPRFQVLVWTQEASSSVSGLWSPTPRWHIAQAFCTAVCILRKRPQPQLHRGIQHVETYLERRLVQSCHTCLISFWLRNFVNLSCSRLPIWGKDQVEMLQLWNHNIRK